MSDTALSTVWGTLRQNNPLLHSRRNLLCRCQQYNKQYDACMKATLCGTVPHTPDMMQWLGTLTSVSGFGPAMGPRYPRCKEVLERARVLLFTDVLAAQPQLPQSTGAGKVVLQLVAGFDRSMDEAC